MSITALVLSVANIYPNICTCIVVIDPRYTPTAAKADKWLPIIPSTDGALACAIAHEILRIGKWNKEFVGDFKTGLQAYDASGFYDKHVNFFVPGEEVNEDLFQYNQAYGLVKWWNLVLKDTTPEWAASRTKAATSIPQA